MYPGYTRTQPLEYAQALAARDLQEMSNFRDIGFRRVLKKKKKKRPARRFTTGRSKRGKGMKNA